MISQTNKKIILNCPCPALGIDRLLSTMNLVVNSFSNPFKIGLSSEIASSTAFLQQKQNNTLSRFRQRYLFPKSPSSSRSIKGVLSLRWLYVRRTLPEGLHQSLSSNSMALWPEIMQGVCHHYYIKSIFVINSKNSFWLS